MASSSEARPAPAADTPPADKHSGSETATATAEEFSEEKGTTETQAPLPASSPTPSNPPDKVHSSESRPPADGPAPTPETQIPSGSDRAEAKGKSVDQTVEEPTNVSTNDTGAASPPPLPDEPLPDEQNDDDDDDDGWGPMWSEEHQAWYFVNRHTQQTQWENPRVPDAEAGAGAGRAGGVGGYNPAIHGDYDPNAWYAKGGGSAAAGVGAGGGAVDVQGDAAADGQGDLDTDDAIAAAAAAAAAVIQGADLHNSFQTRLDHHADGGEYHQNRYSHDAKAGRQLNGFFDVAASGGAHDGRSLKAERSGIKPSKSELKAFKEKRRARKEEKRRAWLRD